MKNKVLVHLLIPEIDENFDIFIPVNIRIGTVIELLNKSLGEMSKGTYQPKNNRKIFNSVDAMPYDLNLLVRETNIRNGSNIILM